MLESRNSMPLTKERIGDLARLWSLGRETVRKLVKDDPGVIKIRMGRRKAHTTTASPNPPYVGYTHACSTPLKCAHANRSQLPLWVIVKHIHKNLCVTTPSKNHREYWPVVFVNEAAAITFYSTSFPSAAV